MLQPVQAVYRFHICVNLDMDSLELLPNFLSSKLHLVSLFHRIAAVRILVVQLYSTSCAQVSYFLSDKFEAF